MEAGSGVLVIVLVASGSSGWLAVGRGVSEGAAVCVVVCRDVRREESSAEGDEVAAGGGVAYGLGEAGWLRGLVRNWQAVRIDANTSPPKDRERKRIL